jgi:RNA polymerase sigma-70 factor (ECF subfamily)
LEATADSTSRSLVRCVLAGDAAAWDRFAAIYVPVVYGWARQTGLQESDARDICQNVFVLLVRNLPKFRHDKPGHSLRAWLRTITKHSVVDWARKRQKQLGDAAPLVEQVEAALAKTDGEASTAADRNLIVRRALEIVRQDVEPATWQMFWQAQVESLPTEEIAAQHQVSVWAVYKAKSRVLARLRELLGEYEAQMTRDE